MNRGEIKTKVLLYMKAGNISSSDLENLIQEGTDDVARRLSLLPKNVKFTVTENKNEYVITDYITDYLGIDKEGFFLNEGTGGVDSWNRLFTYTDAQMEEEFPDWRNDSTSNPERYWIKRNSIFVHPTPSTEIVNGFWIYYISRPPRMTDDTQYPFTGTTTELPQYSQLGEVILQYIDWKINKALDRSIADKNFVKNIYLQNIEREKNLINNNKNLNVVVKQKIKPIPRRMF